MKLERIPVVVPLSKNSKNHEKKLVSGLFSCEKKASKIFDEIDTNNHPEINTIIFNCNTLK